MSLTVLSGCIKQELAAVEQAFDDELASDLACVSGLVRHVSRFRGKMLRPTLVLLAGKASGELTDAHTVLATVVEMVHMATLVHDDVLDEAELRRNGATINHLRGNEAAVMLGDYLISHSYHLCSSLDSQFASRVIARTTNQVCEGELLQIANRHNLDLDEETYLRIITRKTASLCATCCLLGAKWAGADEVRISQLEMYGLSVGIAFQIQDDLLDIAGDQGVVGKTLGLDLEKGKLTLPLIHYLRSATPAEARTMRNVLVGNDPDRPELVREMLLNSPSIDYAQDQARRYVSRARSAIAALPASEARTMLDSMAQFVISRGM